MEIDLHIGKFGVRETTLSFECITFYDVFLYYNPKNEYSCKDISIFSQNFYLRGYDPIESIHLN